MTGSRVLVLVLVFGLFCTLYSGTLYTGLSAGLGGVCVTVHEGLNFWWQKIQAWEKRSTQTASTRWAYLCASSGKFTACFAYRHHRPGSSPGSHLSQSASLIPRVASRILEPPPPRSTSHLTIGVSRIKLWLLRSLYCFFFFIDHFLGSQFFSWEDMNLFLCTWGLLGGGGNIGCSLSSFLLERLNGDDVDLLLGQTNCRLWELFFK